MICISFFEDKTNVLRDIFNDDFLDDVFGATKVSKKQIRADLVENEQDYNLLFEIPGIDKQDLKILYENSLLTITAVKKSCLEVPAENDELGLNYVHKEINYGTFSRSFELDNIDSDKIKANYTNGILNIQLPKKEVDKTKKFINIE